MDQLKEKIKEGKHGFTIERLPGGEHIYCILVQ